MFEKLLAKRHISHLDLSSVRFKAIEKRSWDAAKAARVELEYRKFLYALARNDSQFLISQAVRDALGEECRDAVSLGDVEVRGYNRPMTVWRLG